MKELNTTEFRKNLIFKVAKHRRVLRDGRHYHLAGEYNAILSILLNTFPEDYRRDIEIKLRKKGF